MSITKKDPSEEEIVQAWDSASEQEIFSRLPKGLDLEATAQETKALQRKREISSALDLLRMILAYSVCDWSLRMVGAWCLMVGIGNLSDVAVLKRLRGSRLWLGKLVAEVLQIQQLSILQQPGIRLRIMDGSSLSQPGSTGTDWRIHISLDLAAGCIDGVEVTDVSRAESFANIPTRPGDIRVGDRGYARAKGLASVLKADGKVIVRVNWHSLSLEDDEGHKLALIGLISSTLAPACQEHRLWLITEQERFEVRLMIAKLPQEAADKARNNLRRRYTDKGKSISEKTLLAAGYVFVLTNLPAEQWTAQTIFKIYRFRWQIELVIKRLKSILHIDHIRSQCPELTQVYILAKLLAALMVDRLIGSLHSACPHWFTDHRRPISFWRLNMLFYEWIANSIRGDITIAVIMKALPNLRRFLCDPPKRREQQLATARNFLAMLAPLS